jgi:succinoglycan biosynthesis protein ExoM
MNRQQHSAFGTHSHISVCICTYKRPDYLKRLLEGLVQQKTKDRFTFSIVVVDNDDSQSAMATVRAFETHSPIGVVYCVEPRQNIALARNRAIRSATGDFVAFIDDDEFPSEDWLLTLYEACLRHGVDGAVGPVRPHFDVQPPAWVVKGRFYDRPTYPTGIIKDWRKGRTGNLLFRKNILDQVELPFRPEFTTGEDQDFTRRMMEKGHVFLWCNEAVAYETVPSIRWNRGHMLRRAFLRGKVRLKDPNFGFMDLMKSVTAVALYGTALPVLLLLGQHVFMSHLIKTCDHAGKLLAFVGMNPVEDKYVTE